MAINKTNQNLNKGWIGVSNAAKSLLDSMPREKLEPVQSSGIDEAIKMLKSGDLSSTSCQFILKTIDKVDDFNNKLREIECPVLELALKSGWPRKSVQWLTNNGYSSQRLGFMGQTLSLWGSPHVDLFVDTVKHRHGLAMLKETTMKISQKTASGTASEVCGVLNRIQKKTTEEYKFNSMNFEEASRVWRAMADFFEIHKIHTSSAAFSNFAKDMAKKVILFEENTGDFIKTTLPVMRIFAKQRGFRKDFIEALSDSISTSKNCMCVLSSLGVIYESVPEFRTLIDSVFQQDLDEDGKKYNLDWVEKHSTNIVHEWLFTTDFEESLANFLVLQTPWGASYIDWIQKNPYRLAETNLSVMDSIFLSQGFDVSNWRSKDGESLAHWAYNQSHVSAPGQDINAYLNSEPDELIIWWSDEKDQIQDWLKRENSAGESVLSKIGNNGLSYSETVINAVLMRGEHVLLGHAISEITHLEDCPIILRADAKKENSVLVKNYLSQLTSFVLKNDAKKAKNSGSPIKVKNRL